MLISCNKLKSHIKNSEDIDWLNIWNTFTIRTADDNLVRIDVFLGSRLLALRTLLSLLLLTLRALAGLLHLDGATIKLLTINHGQQSYSSVFLKSIVEGGLRSESHETKTTRFLVFSVHHHLNHY